MEVIYEWGLKSLPEAESYLKSGITFKELDGQAYSRSDNEFAKIMRAEEEKLFRKIRETDRRNGSKRKT